MNNFFLELTIALLFGIGTFLILRRDMMKIIIGFGIISHAINLYIVGGGVFSDPSTIVPILGEEEVVNQGLIFNDNLTAGILGPIASHHITALWTLLCSPSYSQPL